jgi:hypothetical protein
LTQATDIKRRGAEVVDVKLEIAVVPVADVDRAKGAEYMVREQAGEELPS